MEDGTLHQNGRFLIEQGGKKVTHHPTSGIHFGGFKIPYFKEACDLIISTVEIIPDRFTGWDVAITPDGPTIIEASPDLHIHLSDVGHGGLLKNKHMKNLLAEIRTS